MTQGPSQSLGTTTDYAYDGTMLVREMQANAQGTLTPTATYLQGPSGPMYRRDDTQAEGTYTDAAGTHAAGKARWYVCDGLGSVVGEVDPGGNLTSSGTFDVYGAKRAGGTGAASSRQGFVGALGHVSDAETGLVYMRARYYDPSVGKFISEDAKRSGSNWYEYANDEPTNLVDANGCDPMGWDFVMEVSYLLSQLGGAGFGLTNSGMMTLAKAGAIEAAEWLRAKADELDDEARLEFGYAGADFASQKQFEAWGEGFEGAAAQAGVEGRNHEEGSILRIAIAYQLRLMAQAADDGDL